MGVVLFPWLGLIAPILVAPRRALAHSSGLMLVAAGILVLVSLLTGGLDTTFAPLLFVGALAFGVGRVIPRTVGRRSINCFRTGVLGALGVMALLSLLDLLTSTGIVQSLIPWWREGITIAGRSAGWLEHPNTWGAAALPATLFLATQRAREDRLPEFLTVACVGSTIVLASGSRSAMLGMVIGLVVVFAAWFIRASRRRARALLWAGVLLAVTAAVVVSLNSGLRQRLLAVLSAGSPPVASKNLFVSTEDLRDSVWWRPNVKVDEDKEATSTAAVHLLSRDGGNWTDRLQQRVRLEGESIYTMSVDLQARESSLEELQPAVIGWSDGDGTPPSGLVVVVGANGIIRQETSGEIRFGSVEGKQEDGWLRLILGIENVSTSPIWLELGIAPRSTETVPNGGALLAVRRLQLEAGGFPTGYAGTPAPDRRRLQAASAIDTRMRTYRLVLERAFQRPLLGWGVDGYSELQEHAADMGAAQDHEHSLPLALFYRFGAFGLLAFGFTIYGMGRKNLDAWAIVIAVLSANLFDLTVFSSYVYLATPLFVGMANGLADPSGGEVG